MWRITRRDDRFRVWYPEELADLLTGAALWTGELSAAERRGALKLLAVLCLQMGLRVTGQPAPQGLTKGDDNV